MVPDEREVLFRDEILCVIKGRMVDSKENIVDARYLTFHNSPHLYQTGVQVNDDEAFNW